MTPHEIFERDRRTACYFLDKTVAPWCALLFRGGIITGVFYARTRQEGRDLVTWAKERGATSGYVTKAEYTS